MYQTRPSKQYFYNLPQNLSHQCFYFETVLHKHAETMIKQCAEMMTKHYEMHEGTANDALSQANASLTGPAHSSEGMPMMR